MKKKIIVVLSGGGAKGAFQVGAWNRIIQEGVNFDGKKMKVGVPDAIFGISAGALNGVMIAMGKNNELFKLWNKIAGNPYEIFTSDFLKTKGNKTVLDTESLLKYLTKDISFLQKAGLMFRGTRKKTIEKIIDKAKRMTSLASNQPLADKLKELIKISDIQSEVFKAGYVSLTNGKYYSVKHNEYPSDEDLQKAILASSTIPLVWSPVDRINTGEFELSHLVDGGIRDATPLGDAVKYINETEDADYHFIVISCHTTDLGTMEKNPNLLSIAKRSLYEIAMNEIQNTDLKEFLRINELVKQANQKGIDLYSDSGRKLKSFKVKVISPKRKLKNGLDFSRTSVMDSFAHGYEVAKQII